MTRSFKIVARRSEDRGNVEHGWLKAFHTFSFSSYKDPAHQEFGPLRVINEDRFAAHNGFGTHRHEEFEIFSYIVSGELEHSDSMGNTEIMRRGDVQLTSAGTGISHSEKAHGEDEVHFLQIWSVPSTPHLAPKYYTRHFTDAARQNTWLPIVAPHTSPAASPLRDAPGPAPVHSPLTLFSALLAPASPALAHTFPAGASAAARKAYVHVVQASGYNTRAGAGAAVRVAGGAAGAEVGAGGAGGGAEVVLREGDGAYVFGEPGTVIWVENVGDRGAEVLLFDLE